jgi:hypothetical protein
MESIFLLETEASKTTVVYEVWCAFLNTFIVIKLILQNQL